jgi:hypothetical protein
LTNKWLNPPPRIKKTVEVSDIGRKGISFDTIKEQVE